MMLCASLSAAWHIADAQCTGCYLMSWEALPQRRLWVQVATLYNLCKAVQSFHVRGMVHCSLAPPTFSWFQGGQGWKVAASGDWAQAGMHVRSCYQLRYASPEVKSTSHAMPLLHVTPLLHVCDEARAGMHLSSCHQLSIASSHEGPYSVACCQHPSPRVRLWEW